MPLAFGLQRVFLGIKLVWIKNGKLIIARLELLGEESYFAKWSMRTRITVTIRRDLLRSLDEMIDGEKLRNRSHALEYVLSKSFRSNSTQAVILASGRGVSLRPFTYEVPKPLIPVHGKPLLEYTIENLRTHGFQEIIITVSHLANKIQEYFGDGTRFGVRIKYIKEKRLTGTAGALRSAAAYIKKSPFLLMYGDVLMDVDVTDLLESHQAMGGSWATLALSSVADPSAYGAVKMRGSRVVEFKEKPELKPGVSHLVFAGCAVVDKKVIGLIPKGEGEKKRYALEKDVFPKLAERNVLSGYPFAGQWFDVSTPEIYDQVLKSWE